MCCQHIIIRCHIYRPIANNEKDRGQNAYRKWKAAASGDSSLADGAYWITKSIHHVFWRETMSKMTTREEDRLGVAGCGGCVMQIHHVTGRWSNASLSDMTATDRSLTDQYCTPCSRLRISASLQPLQQLRPVYIGYISRKQVSSQYREVIAILA